MVTQTTYKVSTVEQKNIFLSFLPSTVRAWNNLTPEAKQTDSLNSFKHFLNRDKSYVPKYYYSGKGQLEILHTRLRMNCSSLNNDLYLKNITDSPLCRCGSIENTYHFFFQCSYYTPQRALLFDAISRYCGITLHLLLFGDTSLSHDTNKIFFNKSKSIFQIQSDFSGLNTEWQ